MADNYQVKDAAGTTFTIAAKDRGSEKGNRVYPQVADLDVATNNPMPSVLTAGEAHAGQVGGTVARSDAPELTRPSDTTAYTALDSVSNSTSSPAALTFAGVGRVNAGTGYITRAVLFTSQVTNTARFRLHLYSTAPTPINDNAAGTMPLYADYSSYIGWIDFPGCQPSGSGATAAFAQVEVRLPFRCAGGSQALYGLLQAVDAFTPASAQTFRIGLDVDQN